MGIFTVKNFKCPICEKRYVSVVAIWDHMAKSHDIPEGMPPDQYYYDLTHKGKKTLCVECHQPTLWNPRTHKYSRICNKKECRQKIRERFKTRMLAVGKDPNQAQFADHQRKMLAGRRISGTYEWEDGGTTQYTGLYEKDFLAICENLLEIKSKDIIGPSPNTYKYTYGGKEHFYIPDFFIPDLLLEIEVKDGGDNPNMHHKIQDIDKVKEAAKDRVMMRQHDVHYVKVVDKKYGAFVSLFKQLESGELTKQQERLKVKIV